MNYKAITHILYSLTCKKSGLLPTPVDARDFNLGIFGLFDYKPKHNRLVNKTLSIKNQQPHNTCQWNATIVSKEPDEKAKLNVRTFTAKGRMMRLVSGDGFSDLRSGQKVLKEWGACLENVIAEYNSNWSTYSMVDADLYKDRAAKHKIGSYWTANTRDEILKALDDGRILTTGLKWYTGFNIGGGFRSPWLITKIIGRYVGGHAVVIKGYDLNYQGRKVYIFQNSYGEDWGDDGDFYIDMDYFENDNYGCFVNMDEIDKEVGDLITKYDGKNVKGKGDSGIFHIQKGKKKPYVNWESYLSWNGKIRGFYEVDKNVLDRIEVGEKMDITKTDYWQFLKDVKEANRLEALLTLLNKND